MKKLLSVLLVTALVLAALPLTALPTLAATSGDFNYAVLSETDKTCAITDYTGSAKALAIPSELDGYTVTRIDYEAFYGYTALTSITIPDSVTHIGAWAFSDCTALTSITIPDSVTGIGGWAFHNTAYYNDATHWENDVLYIGNYLIDANDTLSGAYTVRAGTKAIANDAFYNCTSLTGITLPNSVTCIGSEAFYDCTALESITIPDSVTNIGNQAFFETAYYNDTTHWENDVLYIGNHLIEANDTLSGTYTVRAGTKTIADEAFDYCTALESITIPYSVTSIGVGAFYGCTALTSITIPNSVTSIGDYAFYSCTALTEIKVDTGNPNYTSESGVLFNQNKTELLCYPAGKQDRSYTIPNSVMSIGKAAFSGCTALTDITIPNSVTSIGYGAFRGCTALTSITIPNSVTSIGDYAFSGCTLLTTIYGYTGSYAETYANTNGYAFVALPSRIQDGDVNGDDKINAVDARWVLQAASGARVFDATQTVAADVNGDGKVNAVDARWILQVASGARTL